MNITKKLKLNNIKEFNSYDLKKIKESGAIWHMPISTINFIFKKRDNQIERGGFLIGFKIADSSEYIITAMSLPIKNDKANIESFQISRKHKKIVKKYRALKEKNLIIIGIWHTHPGTIINPSSLDSQLYRRLSKKSNQKFSLHTITSKNMTNFIIYDNEKEKIKNAITS